MNIFYCPLAVLQQHAELDETESRHLAVLRKKAGDEVKVFDGKGTLFNARIDAVGKKTATLFLLSVLKTEEPVKPALHIAIAPSKNVERFEWFCEKATEIGITEITPLLCEHSERKELRADRIEKVLLSAAKQSLKLHLPVLNKMTEFSHFIYQQNYKGEKLIAYCDEKAVHLKDALSKYTNAVILIGPEGDFAETEIKQALQAGFKTVSLGKSRLRLETAGIFAAAVFNLTNE